MFKDTAYKLYPFESDTVFTYNAANLGFIYTGAATIYKLGEIVSTYNTINPTYNSITQLTSKSDYSQIIRSKLTTPTVSHPICFTTNAVITPATVSQLLIKVLPKPDVLTINCLFKPSAPLWSFTTGALGQYVYDSANSVQFELDTSEQTNLTTQILKYCGIIINDPTIIQVAEQEAQQVSINEKS